MSAISQSAAVSAPADKILDIILDVEAYPTWQKDTQKAVVLEKDDQGRPARAMISVTVMGQEVSYTVAYDYPDEHTAMYRLIEGDMMTKNDARFSAVPTDDGGSELTVEMDLAVKLALPAFMVNQFILKGVKDMIQGIRAKAEH